ncbi:uroporphyrinogen-III synthase [Microbulbifer agarilyticus]|uniref:uroporphyrinogen-III synthase n=1 Tax=Microbulbifer agarilyticus TaxID=260552 RepID=UPI001CD4DD3F|nr:uroporphyrinogen-III synthase [Microbulbifer agarilyticus]MCA0894728.1 uroporphyrinogen-III synthase [Microbulbifer agarilyticus]
MTPPLAGQRILITRPAHQSDRWQALLQAQGAMVDSIPMLAIEPVTDADAVQAVKSLIMDFDQFDHAIFVSQNAVQFGFDWLDDYWPQLPQGPRYYAIGAATAKAICNRGAEPESCDSAAMDSEALLGLPPLQNPDGERVILFRGQGGRPLIGQTLAERGARVDYCELYQRLLPSAACEQLRSYAHTPDAITLHSGETLENLQRALEETGKRASLNDCPLILPSQRVAEQARALGFGKVFAAKNAGDAAMLDALSEAVSSRHC